VDQAFFEFAAGGRPRLELNRQRLTLGRAPANDVQLDDSTVSGQHAVVEWQPDGWTITDLGSSNGTHVNGRRIDQPRTLNPGDTVRVGHLELVYRVPGTVLMPESPAPAQGYLDVTDEWRPPPGVQAGPGPPGRAQPKADRRPADAAAAPIQPYSQAAAGGQAVAGNDPIGTRRNGGFGQVRGVARNVKRQARDHVSVLLFRVERYDGSGNRLSPVAVEFRNYKSGQLSDGEEVEVIGSWKHGTLRASKISNLTTHVEVRGPSLAAKSVRNLFITIFLIIWGTIALVVVVGLLSGG
jgi:hypothetical protein